MVALGVDQTRCALGRTRPPVRRAALAARASSAAKDAPAWAGDGPLSAAVNTAINTPWLFKLMQLGAKKVVRDTAESKGIAWTEKVDYYKERNTELLKIFDEINDASIEYPSYYTMKFHAYEEGNLNWDAAYEAESAAYVMSWRTYKDDSMNGSEAFNLLRKSITDIVKEYRGEAPIGDILDVGCSVGYSTRFLAQEFPDAELLGLDLSPHFLAVAEHSNRMATEQQDSERIKYVHALAEDTGLPDASFDFSSMQFVLHECPSVATVNILKETFRLLRPGGVMAFVDNNPQSDVIRNLPPVLFTLMKSTEPWSDQYYTLDFERTMSDIGFQDVKSVPCDSRHRVVLGRRPE